MAYRCVDGGDCIGCGECSRGKAFIECENCAELISDKEEYFEVLGVFICSSCMEEARSTAECDFICSICAGDIEAGELYFDIGGEKLCRYCTSRVRRSPDD